MRDDIEQLRKAPALRLAHAAVESRSERAFTSAFDAVDDLNLAIHTAKSPEELREVRKVVEDVIAQLLISSSVALTLDEFWEQR